MSEIKELTCAPGEIAIRMFCQGLGDCFLIGLGREDGSTFKIMVDCGVIIGTPNDASLLNQVAAAMGDSTGKALDALVITHEHWDHVGAFYDMDRWAGFTTKEVWVAWTENRPADAFAQQLYDEKHQAATKLAFALRDVHTRLQAAVTAAETDKASEEWEDSTSFLSFLGFDTDSGAAIAAGASPVGKTEKAFDNVKALAPNRYFMPGDVEPIGSHFEIAFLGPPHDGMIKKPDDPGGKHTYKKKVIGVDGDDDGMGDPEAYGNGPFDSSFRIDYSVLPAAREAASKAGKSLDVLARYESEDENWRKLSADAAQLALDLDSATNNTSLAFAIALHGEETRYLLFVADAQVGNWLSWDKQTYKLSSGETTIDDIFANTAFYKVGHHGSHNATLKDRGLELMTRDGLSAFLPLDEDIAKNKKHWPMPWPALYAALKAKAGNRIGRSDMLEPVADTFAEAPARFTELDRPVYLEWRLK